MTNLAIQAREAMGETPAGFAKLLGVNRSTVSRWESGGKIDGPSTMLMKLVLADPAFVRAVAAGTPTVAHATKPVADATTALAPTPPPVQRATRPAQPKVLRQLPQPYVDTRMAFDTGTGAPRASARRVEEERDDGFVGAGAPPPKTPVVNSDTGPPAGQAAAVESTTDPGKNLALGGPGDPNSMTPEERFRAYGF